MPCATIHLMLAGRVWEEWRREPQRAPLPLDSSQVRDAFLHGALAPDMGFIPGVDRFVSDVVHYVRTGDLARELLTSAREDHEVAFALGWATHVLGDKALHPLVGRGVGEILYGDRDRRVNAGQDVETHVSLEVGIDITFLARDDRIPEPPRRPAFDRAGVRHLSEALARTYGIEWPDESLVSSHRRAVRLTARWPRALRLLGAAWGLGHDREATGARGPAYAPLLRLPARLARPGTPMAGFLAPRCPPDWIVDAISGYAEEFGHRFGAHVEGRLEAFENWNLETGRVGHPADGHPDSEEVRARLHALRAHRGGRRAVREPPAPCPTFSERGSSASPSRPDDPNVSLRPPMP